MADSGYKHTTRKEIIRSAVTKFYRQVLEQETGGRNIYRSAEDMAESRRLKSLLGQTWFKSKRGGLSATAVKDLPHYEQNDRAARLGGRKPSGNEVGGGQGRQPTPLKTARK